MLWCAVRAVQSAAPHAKVVVYSRVGPTAASLQEEARKRFNVHLIHPIEVVPLRHSDYLSPKRYPRFTLIGQAWGSVRVGWEALEQLVPEVFIDTTGWSFTYPLARLAGSKVVSYTHYPTVSTNMLNRVYDREETYNNNANIANSGLKSALKVLYYKAFALLYGVSGAFANVVMVNSSWTARHIEQLWWRWREPLLVYPPVDTVDLQQLPLDRRLKHLFLVSVQQFRPEKNIGLQLQAYAQARRRAGNDKDGYAVRVSRLKIIGGQRNSDDAAVLSALQEQARELGIADHVDWIINASYEELKRELGGAVGGLHSMVDEHFGISVVEYMAAGVIPVANNSGGPKEDIVIAHPGIDGTLELTGFLASTVDEYATAITQVLIMDQRDRLKIAAAAQRRAQMFSTEVFHHAFMNSIAGVLPQEQN